MKKLLFQLDTDAHPAVFDTVVAYDGGADHVIGHGDCAPNNVTPLVEGAIFTRSPKEKKYTALFVGGSDMMAGEALFKACCWVSPMLDAHCIPRFRMWTRTSSRSLRAMGLTQKRGIITLNGGKDVSMSCVWEG